MWLCFFQRGLQNEQLQLQTFLLSAVPCSRPLYLVLISDLIISLLLVSVELFGVNFCLFFQDYFWLCQRLPQRQASARLSLTSRPLRPCDLLLHADRNRASVGRPQRLKFVYVQECDSLEIQYEIPSNSSNYSEFETGNGHDFIFISLFQRAKLLMNVCAGTVCLCECVFPVLVSVTDTASSLAPLQSGLLASPSTPHQHQRGEMQ